MVAARGKYSILVANPATGKDLLRLDDVRSRAFALTSQGKLIAWSRQGEILLRSTDPAGSDMRIPSSLALVLAFSPDGTLLAVLEESVVRFWDVAARKEIGSVRLKGGRERLTFSPDSARLAVAMDRSVAIVQVPGR
jgi:WD40 repeat protein